MRGTHSNARSHDLPSGVCHLTYEGRNTKCIWDTKRNGFHGTPNYLSGCPIVARWPSLPAEILSWHRQLWSGDAGAFLWLAKTSASWQSPQAMQPTPKRRKLYWRKIIHTFQKALPFRYYLAGNAVVVRNLN